jgi:plastocyanin
MHSLALTVTPVLAAEKSKVPFYIAGGLLVLWALVISLGLGLRDPKFPGNLQGQRTVSAITILLVIAAVSTAVLTSGPPEKTVTVAPVHEVSPASTQPLPSGTSSVEPAAGAAPTSTTPAASTPAATTGPTSAPAAGASTTVQLAANPTGQLSYNTKTLTAKAGTVTIAMTNMAALEHNVTVAQGGTVLGATPTFAGGTRSLTLKLKPGTYTFYCSVPGHRQAGMEGTLTVK